MVYKLAAFIDETYVQSVYDSCKNVIMSSTNGPAMDFLCGQWGSYACTPHRWYDYMGSTENGFSPFDIIYSYVTKNETVDGFLPYNTTTIPCNEMVGVSNQ
jgi:Niemann-Pick C1 protein